jgi:Domain of unknown function (DUF1830)
MAQILDSLPPEQPGKILCCYVNVTSKIQVARITDVPNWYFERVVFPGQRLVFEAPREAHLEIHTGMMASAILSDHIPCSSLFIDDVDDTNSEASDSSNNNRTNVPQVLTKPGDTAKTLKALV